MATELIWNTLQMDEHQLIWCEDAPGDGGNKALSCEDRRLLLNTAVLGGNVQKIAHRFGLSSVTVIWARDLRRAARRRRRDSRWRVTVVL